MLDLGDLNAFVLDVAYEFASSSDPPGKVRLSKSLASPEPDDSPVNLRDAVLKPLREIRLSDGLLKLRTAEIARAELGSQKGEASAR